MEENISDRIVAKFKSIIPEDWYCIPSGTHAGIVYIFGVCSPFVDILVYARAE